MPGPGAEAFKRVPQTPEDREFAAEQERIERELAEKVRRSSDAVDAELRQQIPEKTHPDQPPQQEPKQTRQECGLDNVEVMATGRMEPRIIHTDVPVRATVKQEPQQEPQQEQPLSLLAQALLDVAEHGTDEMNRRLPEPYQSAPFANWMSHVQTVMASKCGLEGLDVPRAYEEAARQIIHHTAQQARQDEQDRLCRKQQVCTAMQQWFANMHPHSAVEIVSLLNIGHRLKLSDEQVTQLADDLAEVMAHATEKAHQEERQRVDKAFDEALDEAFWATTCGADALFWVERYRADVRQRLSEAQSQGDGQQGGDQTP